MKQIFGLRYQLFLLNGVFSLIDQGVNLNMVRQTAGHASEKTALQNYTLDRATESKNVEKYESALNF